MLSLSETCTTTVDGKTKMFPYFSTGGDKTTSMTTTTTTSRKEKINLSDISDVGGVVVAGSGGGADYYSDQEICFRRKNVTFGFADSLSERRPFSMPNTEDISANNEHINNIKRLSTITQTQSSVVGFGSARHTTHNLWYEAINYTQNNSFVHNSKSLQHHHLSVSNSNSNSCYNSDNEKLSSDGSSFKRGNSIRQSWNNLWRKRKGKSKDMNGKVISEVMDGGSKDLRSNTVLSESVSAENQTTSGIGDSCESDLSKFDLFEPLDIATAREVLRNGSMKLGHRRVHSYSGCTNYRSTNSVGLGIRSAPATPLDTALIQQANTVLHGQSVTNLNALSRSPSHLSTKSDSKSLKPQLSNPSAPVAATRSSSPHPLKSAIKNDPSDKPEKPEKEKKKKSISTSRQKKFYRHFQQLSIDDENVINYFSCALVSDILLQGHLYITNNYFAFYSNVFGYVTKLLIPIVSVVNISKEKTAKIIPNAVGVTTLEDRHVFASFISREAAFRLMISIWRPVDVPAAEVEDIIAKVPDVEISECSIEDDSSCSISGNESSSQVKERKADIIDNRLSEDSRIFGAVDSQNLAEDIPPNLNTSSTSNPEKLVSLSSSASLAVAAPLPTIAPSTTLTITSKISSKLKQIQQRIFPNFQFLHFGVILAVLLALFSCFLMYKIHLIQNRTFSFRPEDFQLGTEKNGYAEVLKWQKQLQVKSTEEAHIVLSTNLEQIAQVRKSLQTLSDLLHDTTKKYYSRHSDSNLNDDTIFVNDKT